MKGREGVRDVKRPTDPTPMALTLAVWLCALPFVLLLVGPPFGWRVAAMAAGGLLMALAVICRGVCDEDRALVRG